MKLAKTLLATTLALTAASTFAASKHDQAHNTAGEEKRSNHAAVRSFF
ncbi:hypothetical protein AAEX34_000606 [Acinetobacter baumannii]